MNANGSFIPETEGNPPSSLSGGEAPSETVCDGSGVRVNAGRPGGGVKKSAVVFGSGWQR